MQDFSDFHETVYEMMQEFGFLATYIKKTNGTYNTSTSDNVGATSTNISVQAVLLEYNLKKDGLGENSNTLIKAGDKLLFIRPYEQTKRNATHIDVDPTIDRVQIGTTIYKIVTFKEHNTTSADQILIELYIRR